jgi:type II secretory pathway pseudopilin PulG
MRNRSAFTLIDILVAVTIISILAAVVMGAVGLAGRQAKTDSTEMLVEKLNRIALSRYEEFRLRRVPIDLATWAKTTATENNYDIGPDGRVTPRSMAQARLDAIRELMRMEMPDRWSDVTVASTHLFTRGTNLNRRFSTRYQRALDLANSESNPTIRDEKVAAVGHNAAAECLYMIVMAIPDTAEQFHESEIGDTDGDGLPEFVDAWGRPIRFMRWPAGFTDSQILSFNEKTDHDPFDPLRLDFGTVGVQPEYRGCRLLPLN